MEILFLSFFQNNNRTFPFLHGSLVTVHILTDPISVGFDEYDEEKRREEDFWLPKAFRAGKLLVSVLTI